MSSSVKNINIQEFEDKYGEINFSDLLNLNKDLDKIIEAAQKMRLWTFRMDKEKHKMTLTPYTFFFSPYDDFIVSEKELRPEDMSTQFIIPIN